MWTALNCLFHQCPGALLNRERSGSRVHVRMSSRGLLMIRIAHFCPRAELCGFQTVYLCVATLRARQSELREYRARQRRISKMSAFFYYFFCRSQSRVHKALISR
jgi:hypothetical protein